jgi:predicted ATPase/DNA-binding SARP family transcriptional activator
LTENVPVSLTVRLFGQPEIREDGTRLGPLRTRKGEWLLALLALQHGRPIDRGRVAGILWPDSPQSKALYNLRRTLSDLRGALGPRAACLVAPTPHTLALDLTAVAVDLLDFDAAVARGDPASLARAVSLYNGPLLAGCMEAWVLPERHAREQLVLAALEQLATHAHERGDYTAAISLLQRATAVDPLRETVQRALLRAMAASGNPAGAILAYREFRLRLHRELNAQPTPETEAVFQELRRDLCGATPRSRAIESAPGPSSSSGGFVPRPLTALIGRLEEVREVRRRLEDARLVTLTGPGGVGKTRLAIQVATDLTGDCPDGVWFVDLGALRDGSLVDQAVATAIEVREQRGRSLLHTLRDALRTRHLLLVLDTCEHVVEGCAHLAETLLHACPHLCFLATSRQPLGLTGEILFRVPSLSLPPVNAPLSPDHLLESEAIRLFVERAIAAVPEFALTPRNAAATLQVCRRLDGIPLAIELAASRLGVMTVEQVAERLDQRFDLLSRGSRTALPRHQTLRATMDWSHELLTDAEQTLLRQLSVFAGRFSLAAAEAVCGEPDDRCQMSDVSRKGDPSLLTSDIRHLSSVAVVDLLTSLVEKSLVTIEGGDGEARYRLLDATREYALEALLQSGEWEAVRRRHATYFREFAERARPFLYGPQQAEWLDRLETVHRNVCEALTWFTRPSATAADTVHSLHLAMAMARFWWNRGYLSEHRSWLTKILAWTEVIVGAVGGPEPSPTSAAALEDAGNLARYANRYEEARALLEASLAIYEQLGDERGCARALDSLGYLAAKQEDPATAAALHERSLPRWRKLDDPVGIARACNGLGSALCALGEPVRARDLHQESLALYRKLGDRLMIGLSCSQLGVALYGLGDFAAARVHLEEALQIMRELGNHQMAAWALHHLAATTLALGTREEARAFYLQGMAFFAEQEYPGGLTDCLRGLAQIEADTERSARLLGASEALRTAIGASFQHPFRAPFERHLAALRETLGEEAFAAAWTAGSVMTAREAIAVAMGEAG